MSAHYKSNPAFWTRKSQGYGTSTGIYVNRNFFCMTKLYDFFNILLAAGMQNYIGVNLQELTSELSEHFGVKEGRGLLVAKVLEDSPAEKAGLRVGDVIVKADGERVERVNVLQRLIRDKDKGEKISIEYLRDKKKKTVVIEVETEEREFEFSSMNWDKYTGVFRKYSDKLQNQYKESQKKYKEDSGKYFEEAQKNYQKMSEEMKENSKKVAEGMKESSKKVAETYRKSIDKARELFRSAYERYRCIRV